MKHSFKHIYSISLAFIITISVMGCSATGGIDLRNRNYGFLSWNEEVTKEFENNRISTAYNYYFSGPDDSPVAVIGIERKYTLVSNFWKPVSLDARRLRDWIWWMNLDYHQTQNWKPRGYRIMDQDGNQVGAWYSAWDWTVVKKESDNRVILYTPFINDRSAPAFRDSSK